MQRTAVNTPWNIASVTDSETDVCDNLDGWGGDLFHLKHQGGTYMNVSSDGTTHLRNQLAGLVAHLDGGNDIFIEVNNGNGWSTDAEYDLDGGQALYDAIAAICGPAPYSC